MSWDGSWDGIGALEMFSISRDRVIHTREEPPGSFTVKVDAIVSLTGDHRARIEVVESRPSGRTIHRVVWESE